MAFTTGEQDVLVSKLEIDVTDFSRPGYVTTIRVKFQNTKVYEIHLLNIGNSFNKPTYEIDSYIY